MAAFLDKVSVSQAALELIMLLPPSPESTVQECAPGLHRRWMHSTYCSTQTKLSLFLSLSMWMRLVVPAPQGLESSSGMASTPARFHLPVSTVVG